MKDSTRVPRICAHCGTSFLVYPSDLKASPREFCTPTCRGEHLKPFRICLLCGNPFRAHLSVIELGGGKFCSHKCSRKGQRYVGPTFPSAIDRFWAAVDKQNECWLWTASVRGGGYGRFYCDGKIVPAHRFSYELHVGPVPDGLQVLH